MKAIEYINMLKRQLREANINQNEVYFLMEEICGISRSDLFTLDSFSPRQEKALQDAILERIGGKSLQVVLGYNYFCGVRLVDDKNTLTPRPETEYMTSLILHEHKGRVLDMCAGSGAIGLALAKAGFDVTLCDLSDFAISAIFTNAKQNNLEVKVIKSDMFATIDGKYDIIVSNPPYIPSKDIAKLDKVVTDNDPKMALDGGDDGLDFYRVIAQHAHKFLANGGILYLEIGINQEKIVQKLLENHYKNIKIIKDLQGIDRIIRAELK